MPKPKRNINRIIARSLLSVTAMNCRDIEPLLSAERDDALTSEQRVSLDRHMATCPACSEMRAYLLQSMDLFKSDTAAVVVPDAQDEWLKLRANLSSPSFKRSSKRSLAPVIWFGAPLAAAAAVALAFFNASPSEKPLGALTSAPSEVAQAEYVEAGNTDASTIVYVDKDSGWLVVWASDGDSGGKKTVP